jgi:uncharacterized membrane protein YheB (UPF0754 family)
MPTVTRFTTAVKRIATQPRTVIVALVVSGLVAAAGGAAMATRSAGDQFADKALEKLGGDSDQILDSIADKVVEKLTSKGGTLDEAQEQLVDQLAAMAGKKFNNVDPAKLITQIRGDVVDAGLDKLDGISVDQIVGNVTSALIQQADGLLDGIDVEKLAKGAISDLIKSLNLEKLVKAKIDSVDVEKLAEEAIAKQMKSASSNPLSSLFGLLGSR